MSGRTGAKRVSEGCQVGDTKRVSEGCQVGQTQRASVMGVR